MWTTASSARRLCGLRGRWPVVVADTTNSVERAAHAGAPREHWHALHDSDRAVIVAQRQVPGRMGLSDFTAASDLEASLPPRRCRTCRTTSAPAW